ncbi:MAG: cobalamin adenosyltransferase [Rhodocyclales bacterium RIFCSPLOWO2_02_FULL_63_24]|nr:MAG: cobalamin adenosyltransferase [Rhodocyclales bacterium GWA2_65_19]OHC70360.1 MAG: cobalamin adenosyltransferase [Rhodocyclales bacterium RIFCSPLOWO2_02_FULL_63_24]
MGHRLSKIYTRTGDAGTTGLGDGSRTAKNSARVAAMGDVDELNSLLGVILCEELPAEIRELLIGIQHDLFDLGGEMSIPGAVLLKATQPARLEAAIDRYNADLGPLKEFILPGAGIPLSPSPLAIEEGDGASRTASAPGSEMCGPERPSAARAAALTHLARTVCRRAERAIVALAAEETVSDAGRQYLNRLSDLLFVLGRWLNKTAGGGDVLWQKGRNA